MDYELPIRLFLITPLLFYTGFSILHDRTHTSSIMFHVIVVSAISLMLFFHLKYLLKMIRRIFNNQKYQHEFGVLLICFAFFMLLLCAKDTYYYYYH